MCERFATSKLREFEDLSHIATFGFRGEALASISHVSHLKVTSQTEGAPCAFRAVFQDGRMVGADGSPCAKPAPCAGVRGTTITVEDLFYNTPLRLKAVRNTADEYQRVVELVARYALHYSGTALTCKKQGENTADVHTMRNASVTDNVKALFGFTIARELMAVTAEKPEVGLLSLKMWATNANFNLKKGCFILFINNRLVDCTPVKKAIDGVYAALLPKGSHAWVYVALQIDPPNVDVNVHPTKSEVRFLHETEIVQAVQDALSAELAKYSASRTFLVGEASTMCTATSSAPSTPRTQLKTVAYTPLQRKASPSPYSSSSTGSTTQRDLFGAQLDDSDFDSLASGSRCTSSGSSSSRPQTPLKPTQNKTVRVDATMQTLDGFLASCSSSSSSATVSSLLSTVSQTPIKDEPDLSPMKVVDDVSDVTTNPIVLSSDEQVPPQPQPPTPAAVPTIPAVPVVPVVQQQQNQQDEGGNSDDIVYPSAEPESKRPRIVAAPRSDSSRHAPRQVPRAEPTAPAPTCSRSDDVALPRRRPRNYKPCSLTSVLTTVQSLEGSSHRQLEGVLGGCTLVGFVDAAFVLLQCQTQLYLCNFRVVCEELFRQQVFLRFSNFDRIELRAPLPVRPLLEHACRAVCAQRPADSTAPLWTAAACADALLRMREMLAEYFSLELTPDGALAALPQIVDGYVPDLACLPLFLYYLASEVNWQLESECFHGVAHQLARFYVPRLSCTAAAAPATLEEVPDEPRKAYEACVQRVLLPAVKSLLYPPRAYANDGTFVQIASLETLYKVFERC